ncbi:MAG: pitrilysin family protein [bacterium]|nr:pitrilysin family protein [bacterium]
MKIITLLFTLLLLAGRAVAVDTQLTILDNGLRIYTREDHQRPLISLFSIVDGGSRTETPDIAGLSHFYEHLIARGGSAKQGETEFRRRMAVIGEEHIYTYDDGTAYGFTVPKENFPEAIWRLADFMLDLKPNEASIMKERTIVMEEYNMSVADNPDGLAFENLFKIAFSKHPYYPTTIGLPEVIKTADLNKLKTFYQERYVPNQIVMVLVGDFKTDELIAQIKEQFGHYPPGRISFEQGIVEPKQQEFHQIADSLDVSSSYVLFGYHIPPMTSQDMPAIRVLTQILGGGANSRLEKALKIDENLVSSYYCYVDFLRDQSLLYIGLQCEPDKEEAAVRKVFATINALKKDPPGDEEIASAKKKLITDDILANETYRGQAETLCHFAISQAAVLADQYQHLIKSVERWEVLNVPYFYLDATQANLSLIEPRGKPIRDYSAIAKEYTGKKTDEIQIEVVNSDPQKMVLSNGMTLVSKFGGASHTVSMAIFIKGGQWLEPKGKEGVAYLTAEMLDKGTEKYTRADLLAQKEKLSIDLWNYASEDYLQIGMRGLGKNLDESLNLIDQMLFHPTFSPDEFKKAKEDQIQAAKSVEDQPWEYTHREALKDLYQKSPYRNLVVGTEESVKKLTLEDVKAYYRRAFVPGNIVVVTVGDEAGHLMNQNLKDRWDNLPKIDPPAIELVNDKSLEAVKARLIYKKKDQNTFDISFLSVGVAHPDYLPMVLTKRLLSTRLFYKYIYDKGIAYRMWTRMFPRIGQSRFYFEMGVSDKNFPIAREGILDDLGVFLDKSFMVEELATAKQQEITLNKMIYQTNLGMAQEMGYWETVGLGYQFFYDLPKKIEAITLPEVEKAARKYLGIKNYSLVNVGTAEVK